jgi:hypothetical protein
VALINATINLTLPLTWPGLTENPPPQAVAVGYNTPTFISSFTAAELDIGNTQASGFNWYPYNYFGSNTNLAEITINSDGSVTLGGDTTGPNGEISTASYLGSAGSYVGTAFGGGAYFEATLKFNPANVVSQGFVGWPSWWAMAWEHLMQTTTQQQWPGQASNYLHYAEVDFFEYNASGFVPTNGYDFYSIDYHDWYGVNSANQITPQYLQTQTYIGASSPDLTQWHKYGCLWVPATATTLGHLQYYFDDYLLQQNQYNGGLTALTTWKQYNPSAVPPPAAAFTATHSIDDYGYTGYSVRVVLNSSLLGAVSGAYTTITFESGAETSNCVVTSCWIGEAAPSGNAYNFDGNQVQVTFSNGSPSFVMGQGNQIFESDPVAFTFNSAKNLIIAFAFSGSADYESAQTGLSGAETYVIGSGDTSNQTAPAGTPYPEAGECLFITSIQVQDYTPISVLDSQHLVPILGTGVSEPITIQSVKVWQASAANNIHA